MDEKLQKAMDGKRLDTADALHILKDVPWTEVVEVGDAIRKRMHPEGRVGYTAFRIVNYTNVCEVTCSFCSFCRPAKSPEAYVLTLDEIRQKTLEAKARGADQIFLQGGVNREIPLSYYTDVLKMLTREMGMKVRGFSPVELVRIAEFNGITLDKLLDILKDAGLTSVPGAGAEILSDRMRQMLSPKKTPEEIIEHLDYVRKTQDIAGGFKSFVVWTFQPQTDKFPIRHVRGDEYLKLLALSRIFLDNVPHIEVSLLGMGLSLGELGLHSGADDINSIVIEENVLQNHGLTTIEAAEDFIRNAGFTPYRRSLNFD